MIWKYTRSRFSAKKLKLGSFCVSFTLQKGWIFPLKSLKIVFIIQYEKLFIIPLKFPSTNSVGAESYSVWEIIHYMCYSFREFWLYMKLATRHKSSGFCLGDIPDYARVPGGKQLLSRDNLRGRSFFSGSLYHQECDSRPDLILITVNRNTFALCHEMALVDRSSRQHELWSTCHRRSGGLAFVEPINIEDLKDSTPKRGVSCH